MMNTSSLSRARGGHGSACGIDSLAGADPLGFAAGDTNLYRYVGNDPTGATDETGLVIDTNPTKKDPNFSPALDSLLKNEDFKRLWDYLDGRDSNITFNINLGQSDIAHWQWGRNGNFVSLNPNNPAFGPPPKGTDITTPRRLNNPALTKLYQDAIIHELIHAALYYKDKNAVGCPLPSGANDFEHDTRFRKRFPESNVNYRTPNDQLPDDIRKYINDNYGNYSDYMKKHHPNVPIPPNVDYKKIWPDINNDAQNYIHSILR